MVCPNCGATLPDTVTICYSCRKQFKNNPESNTGELRKVQPQKRPQKSMQQSAALHEIELVKIDINKYYLIILFCFIGCIGLFMARFVKISFICLIAIIYNLIRLHIDKNRIKELQLIVNGHKRINLCPNCKSPNIEMGVVQSGSVSTYGKTTISDNINPLRPFTHTNINHGNAYTTNTYKNKCHCLDCGAIFNEPEVYYQ